MVAEQRAAAEAVFFQVARVLMRSVAFAPKVAGRIGAKASFYPVVFLYWNWPVSLARVVAYTVAVRVSSLIPVVVVYIEVVRAMEPLSI